MVILLTLTIKIYCDCSSHG